MPRKKTNKVTIQVKNAPPQIVTNDPNKYSAYFENEVGEQFIFVYDYPSKQGLLWLSKTEWAQPIPVVNGRIRKMSLRPSEKAWLKACWTVVDAVEQRHQLQEQLKNPAHFQDTSTVQNMPSHEALTEIAERLYDGLTVRNDAPNCSKSEFVHGWVDFMELVARLEAKYNDKLKPSEG